MSAYQPELGQMAFGQPSQEHSVPDIMHAALEMIRQELDRVMWNNNQERYNNPFGNGGNEFKCDTFEVCAYSWGDDDQPYNFAWKDLRISWYKYLGRGMSASKEITPDLAADCMSDCLSAVRSLDLGDTE